MKKLIIAVLVLVLCVSCTKNGVAIPDATVPTGENFEITFLFAYKGVEIYRFLDGGKYRYFSIGNGSFQPQEQIIKTKNSTVYYIDGVLDK